MFSLPLDILISGAKLIERCYKSFKHILQLCDEWKYLKYWLLYGMISILYCIFVHKILRQDIEMSHANYTHTLRRTVEQLSTFTSLNSLRNSQRNRYPLPSSKALEVLLGSMWSCKYKEKWSAIHEKRSSNVIAGFFDIPFRKRTLQQRIKSHFSI